MKTSFMGMLLAGLLLPGPGIAQTFTTLHSFAARSGTQDNSDGALPTDGLVLAGTTLYGTAATGGSAGEGTVYSVNTNGTGFAVLHTFSALPASSPYNNADGAEPYAGLIVSGSTLFGTTIDGGSGAYGTVFSMNTNGTSFLVLHNFSGGDGGYPFGGVMLSGNTLYGTTYQGGSDSGTLFKVNSDGMGFATIYNFTGGSDGGAPKGSLILSGNTLYGTASAGGGENSGTVFSVNTDGSEFEVLHSFSEIPYFENTNSDGASPLTELVLSGSVLYGVASRAGISSGGTIFSVATNGTGFALLRSLSSVAGDGTGPKGAMILSAKTLYGTTINGGSSGGGSIFQINTDGTGFTTLYGFPVSTAGSDPGGAVVLSNNALFGTTYEGGSGGQGAVFSLTIAPPPRLAIARSGTNVVVTWTNTPSEFTLQSTTNTASAVWSTVSPAPVTFNGINTVTNARSGTGKYYRLIQ